MASKTKAGRVAHKVARVVDAGKTAHLDTVDFSDPNRPKTCLEVDFPIVPVNQVASNEIFSGKPIYQMSKWWARRRSSVFRSLLIAAATKAPEDPEKTSKKVWEAYYANHQNNEAFSLLKVADLFMGGGTTIAEGARLGMNMYGTDLNPVAWFVVKNILSDVKPDELEALVSDVEADLKPKIMPFYSCSCPRCGSKGTWKRVATDEVMGEDFDPTQVPVEKRKDFAYEGPEMIYVFWSKHGPCRVTGCDHRTPLMSKPLIAEKTLTVPSWSHVCSHCHGEFDVEEKEARMAPGVPLVTAEDEKPFAVLDSNQEVTCPHCSYRENFSSKPGKKPQNKRIKLSLLASSVWMKGERGTDDTGAELGGRVSDDAQSTKAWNQLRAQNNKLFEVRGVLPGSITCPYTHKDMDTGKEGGTLPERSHFACGSCGTVQDLLSSVKASQKSAPMAPMALQGFCPNCKEQKQPYRGRFFAAVEDPSVFDAAHDEWQRRKEGDLVDFWPKSELPYGYETHKQKGGLPNRGFTHWWTMFNPRQLLVLSQLLKSILSVGGSRHRWETREFVLGAYQSYLRNQNMFCSWNFGTDKLRSLMSTPYLHPKYLSVENGVLADVGRGSWPLCIDQIRQGLAWTEAPWEMASNKHLLRLDPTLLGEITGKSEKVSTLDPMITGKSKLECTSATELSSIEDGAYDLVITDPPFAELLQYSELSDFFYVWLRLGLGDKYPEYFASEFTPKTLEVVSNRARHPEEPDAFYQRLLTQSLREGYRILKPGGTLAFTFHHDDDKAWVCVLESLFTAGFYLEATYPIRSDETYGNNAFGSQKIEYDILHVCRKRLEKQPKAISWPKMRRQASEDIESLEELLENHRKAGLMEADLQVIRRGKALEFYSRHYDEVYKGEEKLSVREALLGIHQLLEEQHTPLLGAPPIDATPLTRQFMRMFQGRLHVPRDQMIKTLRGTGTDPDEFEKHGWCRRKKKMFYLVEPQEFAQSWNGKHRSGMLRDYDQAQYLIGACWQDSNIHLSQTLNNPHFKPHPALESLLEWFKDRGATPEICSSAEKAWMIFCRWKAKNQDKCQKVKDMYEANGAA